MDKKELQSLLGRYCKNYRLNTLKLPLTQFSDLVGINYQTLNSFETGESSNLYIYYIYYKHSLNGKEFIDDLLKEIEGVKNG